MSSSRYAVEFWSGASMPGDDACGCASHGVAGPGVWAEPGAAGVARWGEGLESVAFSGTFGEVEGRVRALRDRPKLLLVWTTGAPGVERFLRTISEAWPGVPVAGGGAAWGAGENRGQVSPAAGDVAVLAVREGEWVVETANVLEIRRNVEIRRRGVRALESITLSAGGAAVPAMEAFAQLQREFGKAAEDRESITLCDSRGRNVHLHVDGGRLVCGADLPPDDRMTLRESSPAVVLERLESLAAEPNSLVIGCAGLRSVLPRPIRAANGTAVGFLFGEIMPFGGEAMFGNLMAARVRRR